MRLIPGTVAPIAVATSTRAGDVRQPMLAEDLPSMVHVHETGSGGTGGAVRARPPEPALDDWLGDISDDDWSEDATGRAQRRGATPSYEELRAPEGAGRSATSARPAPYGTTAAADARTVVRRRRLVAGLVLAVVLGLAVAILLLLLRGGAESPAPTVSVPTAETPAPEDRPSSAPATPSTSTPSTTTPPATAPSTGSTSAFTLPEGTKLQLGVNDVALVRALQLALTNAGYDPGPPDGTFGRQTEKAVVAFQQDNGLSVDGRVGPETASALNNALAGG